jgi:hypothetical protein
MLETTLDVIRAGLKSDPTVSPADRAKLLVLLRNGSEGERPKPEPENGLRILRRQATADRLGLSTRSVDRLAQQGVLRKVTLPGRRRAGGFREEDVNRLVA